MPVDVLMQENELSLAELKEKSNFAALRDQDEWEFHDLLRDLTDKEDINKYIELAEQGKETASKYFERKNLELQAYYTEIGNAHRVLNVNLINYDKSEPTNISDILRQEKDIKELNIYCNKKHEIHAHQKDKKRYYEFKEGACYEMTSTWPVKDKSGNVSICTMIMNVSSDGITEVLKFNGKDFVSSEEILELIKQNDELYIQGLSLHDAVMKSLEKGKAADVISTTNNNLQNESIVAYQDKEPEGKLDHKVDADNSLPLSSINSNALEVNLQHTETQPEIASQQIGTQAETNSQRMDKLIPDNQILSKENVKLKQEIESGANHTTVKLESQGSDLKDELEEERLKFDIEEPENEYEEFLEDILELTEDEDNVDELKENYSDIIADKILNIEEMKEKIENLNNQVKYLEGQVTHEQRMSEIPNDYVQKLYTITGDISNEPDNAPLQQRKLLRSSSVPPEEERKLSRSSSVDSGLDSDEENCDNGLSSNISPISSIKNVAEIKRK